jgi:hypothetical protein
MRIETAKKIVSRNGIMWTNYFDLDFVLRNTNPKEHYVICRAIKRIMQHLTTGN